MKDAVREVHEVKDLMLQAERTIEMLERLLPQNGEEWLVWRYRNLDRQLRDAKRQLHGLTESLQVVMFEKAKTVGKAMWIAGLGMGGVMVFQVVGKVVEPLIALQFV